MQEENFSLTSLFSPLTNIKAIHIIVILGLLVFANCLFNTFVWDDKAFIINNPEIHSINLATLFGPNLFNFSSYYRPIPALYFAIVYAVSGTNPFLYHVIQITLHIINTVLVFYLLRNFFKTNLSFFLSLIFLVHPMQVESVSFIASSISVLFFLLGISTLLLSRPSHIDNKSLFFIFSLTLLALLTKETAILFIVIICLYRVLFHKPVKSVLIVLLSTIPVYFFMRFFIGHVYFSKENLAPISQVGLVERLQTIPQVIFYYIKTFFFPFTLSVEQHWVVTSVTINNFYMPLFVDILFFVLLFSIGYKLISHHKKQFSIYIFFSVWFLLGLAMHSQIIPLDMTVADRWFYFPMVGILGIIGVVVQTYYNRKYFVVALCLGVIIITLLSIRSVIRNQDWRDPITLYSHDSKLQENFSIENNLGAELGTVGRYEDALMHIQKSITLFPYETNYANLATTYVKLGQLDKAHDAFEKALSLKVYNIGEHQHALQTYIGYIELSFQKKKYKKAEVIAENGLNDYPKDSRLWIYLAYAKYKLGSQKEALRAAENAYMLSPNTMTDEIYTRIKENLPLTINFVDH